MTVKTVKITGKVSDMFSLTAHNENGDFVGEYQGYVPKEIFGYSGDYIELTIDLETGKIVGWVKPDDEEVTSILKTYDSEDDNSWF